MTTITEFIKARLAADEAAAKAAAEQDNEGESWRVRKVRDDGMFVWGEHQAIPPNGKGERLGLLDDAQTRFIESHDPARVLRQVTATRDLLLMVQYYWEDLVLRPTEQDKVSVLGSTAAIWSDHPDFQPEWALRNTVS
jgi:hypothetical protein